jgi:DNA-binding transcriptional regulator LsrR (DeoR family)
MRHIRECSTPAYSVGMSQPAVARSLGLAQGTISKYLNRARRAGLTWPLRPELDDDVWLENRLQSIVGQSIFLRKLRYLKSEGRLKQ